MTHTPGVSEASRRAIAAAAARLRERRLPASTYRLQFSASFTFRDALALVPYLHDLGVTDVYASPILRAAPGSTHGYDVCDHSQLNPELGTMDDFLAFSRALQEKGMGMIVDIVPNHMGINGNCNNWWLNVLESGPASPYASYFDIDWDTVKPALQNKVLLPILEDQYGNVLETGRFSLAFDEGTIRLHYADHELPLAPRSYRLLLEPVLEVISDRLESADPALLELQSILTALNYLPSRFDDMPKKQVERQREKEVIKRRLHALYNSSSPVQTALEEVLSRFMGTPGEPASFDQLDSLIDAQPYRLAYWRVASEEINYRRFFDINTMAALRVELPEVFHETHDLILKLLAEGHVTGLRIDHPDGLWNPARYFRQLQASAIAYAAGDETLTEDAERWLAESRLSLPPVYVVAEKILTETESLPRDWSVMGTTGYDFAALANNLFVDRANEAAFTKIYNQFTESSIRFSDLEYAMKQRIMRESLASEINALAHQLERISQLSRRYRDFTLNGLRHGLREIIANLSIYRTYIDGEKPVSERDTIFITKAVREARRRSPGTARSVFEFIHDTLLLTNCDTFREEDRPSVIDFVMHFQQITGPVMAKSVEDTSFYVYNRLASLNEVGGNPTVFGISPAAFHEYTQQRKQDWQYSMLTLSTHDAKRSEDVRARLNVLSELPDEWAAALARWREINAAKKQLVNDTPAPSFNDEYLLYQTLLGAWTLHDTEAEPPEGLDEFHERIRNYMAKATREAKTHTSWTNPNDDYDRAMSEFVDSTLDDRTFLDSFLPLQRRVAYFGRLNSLSQTLLKLTSPGVPDTYRGIELWDFSLVDPDNRRPVDYERCQAVLRELKRCLEAPDCDRVAFARELLENAADGRIKMFVTRTALEFRRRHSALFSEGDYVPLDASGTKAEHVCAFARRFKGEEVVIIAPRLLVGLANGVERPPLGRELWGDTALKLPAGGYQDLFTQQTYDVPDRFDLANALEHFPVALLVRTS